MSPTYHNLELVVLEKQVEEYEVGDVVAFKCEGLDRILIKRIVACPGDSVHISGGSLFVNGDIYKNYSDKQFGFAGILEDKVFLEDGQYIVIGDNIERSIDSRHEEVGIIQYEDLLGRVL